MSESQESPYLCPPSTVIMVHANTSDISCGFWRSIPVSYSVIPLAPCVAFVCFKENHFDWIDRKQWDVTVRLFLSLGIKGMCDYGFLLLQHRMLLRDLVFQSLQCLTDTCIYRRCTNSPHFRTDRAENQGNVSCLCKVKGLNFPVYLQLICFSVRVWPSFPWPFQKEHGVTI